MVNQDQVEGLAHRVTEIVANPDAAIAIRDTDSVYLWVNEAWEKLSTVKREDTLGKKLTDLKIVPEVQSLRFRQEDLETLKQRRLVSINTYHVQNAPIRFMTVRTAIPTGQAVYIVEVSFILGPLITSRMLGWSSERFERAFGEDLASSIMVDEL